MFGTVETVAAGASVVVVAGAAVVRARAIMTVQCSQSALKAQIPSHRSDALTRGSRSSGHGWGRGWFRSRSKELGGPSMLNVYGMQYSSANDGKEGR